jgi:hypothetical protein
MRYFADPSGRVRDVATNPAVAIPDEGSVRLPDCRRIFVTTPIR